MLILKWVFVLGLAWWWVISILAFRQVEGYWKKTVLIVLWLIVLPVSVVSLTDTLRSTDHAFEIGLFPPPLTGISSADNVPADF